MKGCVDVYCIALDRNDICLSRLKEGECFGIINLFAPSGLETVLKCRASCSLLYIPKIIFQKSLYKNPEASLKYASICNQKLQFLIHHIGVLTMQSCRGKLIGYLLFAATPSVWTDLSKENLARILGVSRS